MAAATELSTKHISGLGMRVSRWASRPPSRRAVLIGRLLVFVGLLGAWQVAHRRQLGGRGIIPAPRGVLADFVGMLDDPELRAALKDTMIAWSVGLAITLIFGTVVGVVVGMSAVARHSSRVLIDFCRAVPPIALLPLLVLVFAATIKLKVIMILISCVWTIIIQTAAGVSSLDPGATESARSVRVRRFQYVRWILIPSSLPYLATGWRLAAVSALLVTIATELLTSAHGVGFVIVTFYSGVRTSEMWATILFAALLGILVSLTFGFIERRLLRWHASYR